jgi:prepilin-type N-terminal cleavage/methylation domain-containing protein
LGTDADIAAFFRRQQRRAIRANCTICVIRARPLPKHGVGFREDWAMICRRIDNSPHARRLWAAFSLIELLVVIAVVALLVALVLPALGKSREASRTTKCLANVRSIGQALTSYADENKDLFPHWSSWQLWEGDGTAPDSPGPGWTELLRPYIGGPEVYHDPGRPSDLAPFCYFMQARFTWGLYHRRYTSLEHWKVQFPSAFVLAGDCNNPLQYAAPYGVTNLPPDCDQDDADQEAVFVQTAIFAHNAARSGNAGSSSVLFLDDHAGEFGRFEPSLMTWHASRFSDWAQSL